MVKVGNIGIFGRRNVGKSSLINILTGQEVSIVSSYAGTTTDAVKKRMEIPEIGPCNIIDTAGIDDIGSLGEQRVKKTEKVMDEVDMAILLFSGNIFAKDEMDLLESLQKKDVPVLVVHNQSDILPLDVDLATELNSRYGVDVVEFSCCLIDEQQKDALEQLISFIIKVMFEAIRKNREKTILEGLVNEGDKIVLVCPIDSEAPQGRLILPQVMAIRDVLDNKGIAVVLQPSELEKYLVDDAVSRKESDYNGVKLVVTDSQAFKQVAQIMDRVEASAGSPEVAAGGCSRIPLTSFSILMARAKGPFEDYVQGLGALDSLKDGDTVLVLESCTHHASCEVIGRVKIPRGLQKYATEKAVLRGEESCKLNFVFVSGLDEIPPQQEYALAIQCGGCMVTRKQLCNRIKFLTDKNVPVVNYGMLLAHLSGIAGRALQPVK